MEMTEFLAFALFYVLCAIIVMARLIKGPSVIDRVVAADSIDILTDVALVLFALYSGRAIYLDIAVVTALLGFLSTVLISKYLEGTL
jgi:multisubunit Na+/H+ antiporter MnhF subunit